MNNRAKLLFLSLLTATILSCDKEIENHKPSVSTLQPVNIQMFSVDLNGSLVLPDPIATDFELGFELSQDNLFPKQSTTKYTVSHYDQNKHFSFNIDGITNSLQPGCTYYFRSYMVNQLCLYYGEQIEFQTDSLQINTGDIDTETYSITCNTNIQTFKDQQIKYGIYYSNNSQPIHFGKFCPSNEIDSNGNFSVTLTDIPYGAFYYCAFVSSANHTYYGEVKSALGNSLTTGIIDDLSFSVTSSLSISPSSSTNIEYGICYGRSPNPTVGRDYYIPANSLDNDHYFTVTLPNVPFEKFYYRSYVFIDKHCYYGNEYSHQGNSLMTGLIDESTMSVTSHISNTIGYNIVSYGICYDQTESQPSINTSRFQESSFIDSNNYFTVNIKNVPYSKFFYRSYLKYYDDFKNAYFIVYGDTKVSAGPSISTGSIDNSSYTVTSSFSYLSDDSRVGVCYGPDPNPTISDQFVICDHVAINDLSYTVTLNEIPIGTFYYSAFVITGSGEAYYGESKPCKGNSLHTGTINESNYTITCSLDFIDCYTDITYGVCFDTQTDPIYSITRSSQTKSINSDNSYTLQLSLESMKFGEIFYRPYVVFANKIWYGDTKSFIFKRNTNGVEYVDLGLSVLWATCNLGANQPYEYGDYYAWGETDFHYVPGSAQSTIAVWKNKSGDKNQTGYYETNYKYYDSNNNTYTKYGNYDGLEVLTYSDDAVSQTLGGTWRTPTKKDIQELIDNCLWTFGTNNNVNGYIVYSTISGYTDKSIFIPLSGYRSDTSLYDYTTGGHYWTSSASFSYPYKYSNAYNLYSKSLERKDTPRYYGLTIRPVCR